MVLTLILPLINRSILPQENEVTPIVSQIHPKSI